MLTSMTGHGEGTSQREQITVSAEVRSTNNRYFKFSVRVSDGYGSLESRLERLVRKHVRRGSVHLALKVDHVDDSSGIRINTSALLAFREQLSSLPEMGELDLSTLVPALITLPGVVEDSHSSAVDPASDWPIIEEAVSQAIEDFSLMRVEEGKAMAADLEVSVRDISALVSSVQERVPQVAEFYQQRLLDRLNKLLSEHSLTVEPSDVVREVGLFVDRSDISEEVVRLKSHLDQFSTEIQLPEGQGRKLDFITQEMFRETNTIGSKANDTDISAHVVEIKTVIERMREMIQNIE